MSDEKKVVFKTPQLILSKSKDNGEIQYFRNNERLKNGDSEDFVEKDFNQVISSETKMFINQKIDNIVVLFGAGASVTDNNWDEDKNGVAKTGVTVAKIAEKVLEKLHDGNYDLKGVELKVYPLDEIANISKYNDNVFETDEAGNVVLGPNFNLEDFLSNLFSFEKFVEISEKEVFENTINAIQDIIVKATSYDYDDKIFKHVKLLNILSKFAKSDSKMNIITTNYDTLIEDAAESMKWTVFDGFSFSRSPQFDSDMFNWSLVKDVPNVKTHENIFKKNVINLLKIHGSLTWERSEKDEHIIRKPKEVVRKPIMVFPSSDKYAQSYQEPYFDLFNKFQNMLQKRNTLLLTIGFSFADNHIARMVLNAIKSNDSLTTLITNFNIDSNIKNWKELEQAMNNYYNVAFLQSTLNGELTDYLGGETVDN
ncbi:SIR2 family protein [Fructobacillus parabroussonetiae]|uniref:SIR2 family protein n=1 Tax=Fructobacillus parabroussonetiae TaxID=2713174 RepID=A0ABS5R030_9LACO|nr:SIR2 family protein [Fructobacillus parabroussonetiae]MBS9337527.1 SIR2 family protein [Fructobacillus parabroussonetiae]